MEWIQYENNAYRTAHAGISLPAKLCPSLIFYYHAFIIVFRGSVKAKRRHYDTAEWCKSSLAIVRALEHVGVDLEIAGIDSITSFNGPCVFIANHMSTLETFVLPAIIAPLKDTTFVVKQSLVEYPIFRHVMRSRDPVTVRRENPREDLKAVLEGGTERLKAGRSIIIFPQTTRTLAFDPEAFNTIGIKLAKKAEVPVVPIALKTDAWGNGKYLKDYGRIVPSKRVHFAFGKPLMVRDRGAEEHNEIIRFIRGKLEEWESSDGIGGK
ncbi:MAG TPA: lysophospholipid acyltransferase family protein [Nitrospirota bacterium]|nr:lysophospholipid acyltransferase family protein [Nitrospirota bacterium]